MLLGRCEHGPCHSTKQTVVVGNEREVDFDALLYRRISQPLGNAVALRFVRDLLANLGQIALTK
jgi:hypothetical protein